MGGRCISIELLDMMVIFVAAIVWSELLTEIRVDLNFFDCYRTNDHCCDCLLDWVRRNVTMESGD